MFTALAAVATLVASFTLQATHAAPLDMPRLKIRDATGPVVAGQYVVKLKDGVDPSTHRSSLPFAFSVEDTDSPIISDLLGIFNGYAGEFSPTDLAALQASPDVEFIEPQQVYNITDQQTDATWGLQSISTQAQVGDYSQILNTDFTYSYSQPSGDGVTIYILDTGILTTHPEFEDRATFGYAAGSMQMMDGHGHGTHCAGTAAGKTYGVAKKANLLAVKVLGDNGQGVTSDIIDGVNWAVSNIQTTGKPSIVSMSLGGGTSDALDAAVTAGINAGITFVVSAGNSAVDASTQSPARVADAITVAAANMTNSAAYFTNFGSVVDIWAPGVNIISAWPFAPNTRVLSGTSMATPHISGLAAYFLSKDTSLNPAALASKITGLGRSNILTGVPDGTVNLLAYNGGVDSATSETTTSAAASSTDAATTTTDVPSTTPSPADATPATPTDATASSAAPVADKATVCPTWWSDCPWANW